MRMNDLRLNGSPTQYVKQCQVRREDRTHYYPSYKARPLASTPQQDPLLSVLQSKTPSLNRTHYYPSYKARPLATTPQQDPLLSVLQTKPPSHNSSTGPTTIRLTKQDP